MLNSKALAASASAPKVYIEECFQSWLYTGNGSTQTITNGIDLSGKGGLVWIKSRSSGVEYHNLFDTARGAEYVLFSNTTDASASSPTRLSSFNSTGFTVGSNAATNANSATFASWTFRKAAKFFDVVTWTGDAVQGRAISHNLGSVPGCIIVKRLDNTGQWNVYHRSTSANPGEDLLILNSTAAVNPGVGFAYWNNATATATEFYLGTNQSVNASGNTYVAYLFAHDAGGFGDSGNDNVVSCGSYTGNSSTTGPTINLGWEPQWLLIKRASGGTGGWFLLDSMRGIATGSADASLQAESSNVENTADDRLSLTSTGFQLTTTSGFFNNSGDTYIYIAIRRGPMKTPTDATSIFNTYQTSTSRLIGDKYDSNLYPPDLYIWFKQSAGGGAWWQDRLRGWKSFASSSTGAEEATTYIKQSGKQDELEYIANWDNATGYANWYFRRAPGFMDVVAYTGTGANRTVSHNLAVVPELIIVKRRDATGGWLVYVSALGATEFLQLQSSAAQSTLSLAWNNTSPTNSVFSVGTSSSVNASGGTYIAYLFATCPGVSKVGSYTGTGTTKDIDCGFTNGSRLVLIKKTDSTGNWYIWDSARGIVSGNDPYLLLNSTAAEVTNTDYIDPLSSGFQISSTAPAEINANGGSYIFLAVA